MQKVGVSARRLAGTVCFQDSLGFPYTSHHYESTHSCTVLLIRLFLERLLLCKSTER